MGADLMTAPAPEASGDVPRQISARTSAGDKLFRGVLRVGGLSVLVILGLILAFLSVRGVDAFKTMGFAFFTTQSWFVSTNKYGVAAVLPFSVLIALVAMLIAVPVAFATALYISEYAPQRLRRTLVTVIDLMAAVPSIVWALFGLIFLEPRILGFCSWLARHLSFIPFLTVRGQLSSSATFTASTFIAGVVVSFMVIPIVTSLSREVFSQAPQAEREGAYALGATRWGMVRTVVVPFGRAGFIGSCMLGMGRALGETIAVLTIISPVFTFNYHILESGSNSISALIALHFSDGSKAVSALMAAGLVLFAITLVINVLGSIVTSRSRSGLATVD
jgi:phosphate transport system permease protein